MPLKELKFTVIFDGAPYTEYQLSIETVADFLNDCDAYQCSSSSNVPNLII